MNDLYERIRTRVEFPLLLQGRRRGRCCWSGSRIRRRSTVCDGELWQGVDVPGDQLSCVIVTSCRLPCRAIDCGGAGESAAGGWAERICRISGAAGRLALKQGFGRLIRTKTDRGFWRCWTHGFSGCRYGKIFLESLPAYRKTQELSDVASS